VPLAQVPLGAKVRRLLPTQTAGGGALHAVSVGVYEHVPEAQVPVLEKVRRRLPWQVAPGGVLQVMPEQGSATQFPFRHP
jgi:hypothetical protein